MDCNTDYLAGIKAVSITLIICEQLDFLSVGKIYWVRSFGSLKGVGLLL